MTPAAVRTFRNDKADEMGYDSVRAVGTPWSSLADDGATMSFEAQ